MTDQRESYPDVSDILARKAAGRTRNGSLSFGVELAVLDVLKQRANAFVQARKIREAKEATLDQKATQHRKA